MRCCQCRCGPIRLAVQLPGSLGSLHLIYHSPDPLSPTFYISLHTYSAIISPADQIIFVCMIKLYFPSCVTWKKVTDDDAEEEEDQRMGEGQCSRVLKCLGNGSATLMARMCLLQVTDTKLSQIYNPLLPTSVCTLHPLPFRVFLFIFGQKYLFAYKKCIFASPWS